MELVNRVLDTKVVIFHSFDFSSKVEIVVLHAVKIQRSHRRYHREENCMKIVIIHFRSMMLSACLFFVIKLLFKMNKTLHYSLKNESMAETTWSQSSCVMLACVVSWKGRIVFITRSWLFPLLFCN